MSFQVKSKSGSIKVTVTSTLTQQQQAYSGLHIPPVRANSDRLVDYFKKLRGSIQDNLISKAETLPGMQVALKEKNFSKAAYQVLDKFASYAEGAIKVHTNLKKVLDDMARLQEGQEFPPELQKMMSEYIKNESEQERWVKSVDAIANTVSNLQLNYPLDQMDRGVTEMLERAYEGKYRDQDADYVAEVRDNIAGRSQQIQNEVINIIAPASAALTQYALQQLDKSMPQQASAMIGEGQSVPRSVKSKRSNETMSQASAGSKRRKLNQLVRPPPPLETIIEEEKKQEPPPPDNNKKRQEKLISKKEIAKQIPVEKTDIALRSEHRGALAQIDNNSNQLTIFKDIVKEFQQSLGDGKNAVVSTTGQIEGVRSFGGAQIISQASNLFGRGTSVKDMPMGVDMSNALAIGNQTKFTEEAATDRQEMVEQTLPLFRKNVIPEINRRQKRVEPIFGGVPSLEFLRGQLAKSFVEYAGTSEQSQKEETDYTKLIAQSFKWRDDISSESTDPKTYLPVAREVHNRMKAYHQDNPLIQKAGRMKLADTNIKDSGIDDKGMIQEGQIPYVINPSEQLIKRMNTKLAEHFKVDYNTFMQNDEYLPDRVTQRDLTKHLAAQDHDHLSFVAEVWGKATRALWTQRQIAGQHEDDNQASSEINQILNRAIGIEAIERRKSLPNGYHAVQTAFIKEMKELGFGRLTNLVNILDVSGKYLRQGGPQEGRFRQVIEQGRPEIMMSPYFTGSQLPRILTTTEQKLKPLTTQMRIIAQKAQSNLVKDQLGSKLSYIRKTGAPRVREELKNAFDNIGTYETNFTNKSRQYEDDGTYVEVMMTPNVDRIEKRASKVKAGDDSYFPIKEDKALQLFADPFFFYDFDSDPNGFPMAVQPIAPDGTPREMPELDLNYFDEYNARLTTILHSAAKCGLMFDVGFNNRDDTNVGNLTAEDMRTGLYNRGMFAYKDPSITQEAQIMDATSLIRMEDMTSFRNQYQLLTAEQILPETREIQAMMRAAAARTLLASFYGSDIDMSARSMKVNAMIYGNFEDPRFDSLRENNALAIGGISFLENYIQTLMEALSEDLLSAPLSQNAAELMKRYLGEGFNQKNREYIRPQVIFLAQTPKLIEMLETAMLEVRAAQVPPGERFVDIPFPEEFPGVARSIDLAPEVAKIVPKRQVGANNKKIQGAKSVKARAYPYSSIASDYVKRLAEIEPSYYATAEDQFNNKSIEKFIRKQKKKALEAPAKIARLKQEAQKLAAQARENDEFNKQQKSQIGQGVIGTQRVDGEELRKEVAARNLKALALERKYGKNGEGAQAIADAISNENVMINDYSKNMMLYKTEAYVNDGMLALEAINKVENLLWQTGDTALLSGATPEKSAKILKWVTERPPGISMSEGMKALHNEENSFCLSCYYPQAIDSEGKTHSLEFTACCGSPLHRACFKKNHVASGLFFGVAGAQYLCPFCSFGPFGFIDRPAESIRNTRELNGIQYNPIKEGIAFSERFAQAAEAVGINSLVTTELFRQYAQASNTQVEGAPVLPFFIDFEREGNTSDTVWEMKGATPPVLYEAYSRQDPQLQLVLGNIIQSICNVGFQPPYRLDDQMLLIAQQGKTMTESIDAGKVLMNSYNYGVFVEAINDAPIPGNVLNFMQREYLQDYFDTFQAQGNYKEIMDRLTYQDTYNFAPGLVTHTARQNLRPARINQAGGRQMTMFQDLGNVPSQNVEERVILALTNHDQEMEEFKRELDAIPNAEELEIEIQDAGLQEISQHLDTEPPERIVEMISGIDAEFSQPPPAQEQPTRRVLPPVPDFSRIPIVNPVRGISPSVRQGVLDVLSQDWTKKPPAPYKPIFTSQEMMAKSRELLKRTNNTMSMLREATTMDLQQTLQNQARGIPLDFRQDFPAFEIPSIQERSDILIATIDNLLEATAKDTDMDPRSREFIQNMIIEDGIQQQPLQTEEYKTQPIQNEEDVINLQRIVQQDEPRIEEELPPGAMVFGKKSRRVLQDSDEEEEQAIKEILKPPPPKKRDRSRSPMRELGQGMGLAGLTTERVSKLGAIALQIEARYAPVSVAQMGMIQPQKPKPKPQQPLEQPAVENKQEEAKILPPPVIPQAPPKVQPQPTQAQQPLEIPNQNLDPPMEDESIEQAKKLAEENAAKHRLAQEMKSRISMLEAQLETSKKEAEELYEERRKMQMAAEGPDFKKAKYKMKIDDLKAEHELYVKGLNQRRNNEVNDIRFQLNDTKSAKDQIEAKLKATQKALDETNAKLSQAEVRIAQVSASKPSVISIDGMSKREHDEMVAQLNRDKKQLEDEVKNANNVKKAAAVDLVAAEAAWESARAEREQAADDWNQVLKAREEAKEEYKKGLADQIKMHENSIRGMQREKDAATFIASLYEQADLGAVRKKIEDEVALVMKDMSKQAEEAKGKADKVRAVMADIESQEYPEAWEQFKKTASKAGIGLSTYANMSQYLTEVNSETYQDHMKVIKKISMQEEKMILDGDNKIQDAKILMARMSDRASRFGTLTQSSKSLYDAFRASPFQPVRDMVLNVNLQDPTGWGTVEDRLKSYMRVIQSDAQEADVASRLTQESVAKMDKAYQKRRTSIGELNQHLYDLHLLGQKLNASLDPSDRPHGQALVIQHAHTSMAGGGYTELPVGFNLNDYIISIAQAEQHLQLKVQESESKGPEMKKLFQDIERLYDATKKTTEKFESLKNQTNNKMAALFKENSQLQKMFPNGQAAVTIYGRAHEYGINKEMRDVEKALIKITDKEAEYEDRLTRNAVKLQAAMGTVSEYFDKMKRLAKSLHKSHSTLNEHIKKIAGGQYLMDVKDVEGLLVEDQMKHYNEVFLHYDGKLAVIKTALDQGLFNSEKIDFLSRLIGGKIEGVLNDRDATAEKKLKFRNQLNDLYSQVGAELKPYFDQDILTFMQTKGQDIAKTAVPKTAYEKIHAALEYLQSDNSNTRDSIVECEMKMQRIPEQIKEKERQQRVLQAEHRKLDVLARKLDSQASTVSILENTVRHVESEVEKFRTMVGEGVRGQYEAILTVAESRQNQFLRSKNPLRRDFGASMGALGIPMTKVSQREMYKANRQVIKFMDDSLRGNQDVSSPQMLELAVRLPNSMQMTLLRAHQELEYANSLIRLPAEGEEAKSNEPQRLPITFANILRQADTIQRRNRKYQGFQEMLEQRDDRPVNIEQGNYIQGEVFDTNVGKMDLNNVIDALYNNHDQPTKTIIDSVVRPNIETQARALAQIKLDLVPAKQNDLTRSHAELIEKYTEKVITNATYAGCMLLSSHVIGYYDPDVYSAAVIEEENKERTHMIQTSREQIETDMTTLATLSNISKHVSDVASLLNKLQQDEIYPGRANLMIEIQQDGDVLDKLRAYKAQLQSHLIERNAFAQGSFSLNGEMLRGLSRASEDLQETILRSLASHNRAQELRTITDTLDQLGGEYFRSPTDILNPSEAGRASRIQQAFNDTIMKSYVSMFRLPGRDPDEFVDSQTAQFVNQLQNVGTLIQAQDMPVQNMKELLKYMYTTYNDRFMEVFSNQVQAHHGFVLRGMNAETIQHFLGDSMNALLQTMQEDAEVKNSYETRRQKIQKANEENMPAFFRIMEERTKYINDKISTFKPPRDPEEAKLYGEDYARPYTKGFIEGKWRNKRSYKNTIYGVGPDPRTYTKGMSLLEEAFQQVDKTVISRSLANANDKGQIEQTLGGLVNLQASIMQQQDKLRDAALDPLGEQTEQDMQEKVRDFILRQVNKSELLAGEMTSLQRLAEGKDITDGATFLLNLMVVQYADKMYAEKAATLQYMIAGEEGGIISEKMIEEAAVEKLLLKRAAQGLSDALQQVQTLQNGPDGISAADAMMRLYQIREDRAQYFMEEFNELMRKASAVESEYEATIQNAIRSNEVLMEHNMDILQETIEKVSARLDGFDTHTSYNRMQDNIAQKLKTSLENKFIRSGLEEAFGEEEKDYVRRTADNMFPRIEHGRKNGVAGSYVSSNQPVQQQRPLIAYQQSPAMQQQQQQQGNQQGSQEEGGGKKLSKNAIEAMKKLGKFNRDDIEFMKRITFDKGQSKYFIISPGGDRRELTMQEKKRLIRLITQLLALMYIALYKVASDEEKSKVSQKMGGEVSKNIDKKGGRLIATLDSLAEKFIRGKGAEDMDDD